MENLAFISASRPRACRREDTLALLEGFSKSRHGAKSHFMLRDTAKGFGYQFLCNNRLSGHFTYFLISNLCDK